MDDFSQTPSPRPDLNRDRLPTLFEVLSRRTLAPVDLFSFYIYMRDQQRSVDYLDFWLDVSQHMSLCRHYVRELRRSVLVETPDLEKSGSKRSSALLDQFSGENNGGAHTREKDSGSDRGYFHGSDPSGTHGQKGSGASTGSGARTPAKGTTPPAIPSFPGAIPGTDDSSPGQQSESPQHTVARADIRASAEKILYTFLIPGSEREIILPPTILSDITESIEQEGRDDPEVFDAAKDYVFQAMERDAFPGFLRAKALGNLVPPSLMMRLIVGLLAMFGGFWTAFILIFLDYGRATRCWLILPFTVGVYSLTSHQYTLDPALALAGFSEYTFMSFSKIREPYVRRLLTKRALVVGMWFLLFDVALIVLFVFVPGKRL